MAESGQRAPYPKIIDVRGLKTKKRVFWETVLTLGLWGVFLYLIGFIAAFILWLLGLRLLSREIYEMGSPEIVRLFKNAVWVTAIVVLPLLLWSYYNYFLFKIRGERRCSRVGICFDKYLADFFKVDPEMLEKVKNYSRVSIVMEGDTIIMPIKDTEMTSHSPSPLPLTQDSPSIPSATMPVLDKAIQEFSAAFNELQGIIRELGSQEEQKTAADLENKALEHYYRELFTDAPGGYLVIDTEATIQECNQAAADMLGMHKDFLSGKRLEVFVIQKDYYSLYSLMDQALEGNETRTATVHLLPPSGTPIPVFLSIAARKNPAGEFIGFNCLMHHLTQGQQDEESLKNKITQLENCLTGLVKAFSTASEMQNPYASGHQKRVAQLAVAIAREMGFSPDLVEGVNIIGFLHDIGSVAMPSIFLNKPGLLTIVESNILKTHSQMGHDLLKDIEFSWPVAKAVQQHHERWNGSGYPSGLSGEDIIMEARILAVAEVVEAMVSPAPYGKALAIEKAADELNKGKGILYDPTVVDACLKLLMEGGFKFS